MKPEAIFTRGNKDFIIYYVFISDKPCMPVAYLKQFN